jgi:hypothetical protein
MPVATSKSPREQKWYEWSLRHTILIPIILFIIAVIFKILDVFVFHIDERLGEIIISKSLGFLLVVAYLWLVGKSVRAIGLHGRFVEKSLIIGSTGIIIILLFGYGLQFWYLRLSIRQPA